MTAFPPQPAFGARKVRALFRIALTLLAMFAIALRPAAAQSILRDAETEAYLKEPFYLSEEEKTVIRMLYSPEVRSGLHIETFVKKMKFSEDEKFWLIPEVSKRKAVVIYPSPCRD